MEQYLEEYVTALFLIYINNLPLKLPPSISQFSCAPDLLTQNSRMVQRVANVYKCTSHNHLLSCNLPCNIFSSPLEYANSYKYLGITLSPNLSLIYTHRKHCQFANRSLGYVRRNFRSFLTNLKCLLYVILV